MKANVIGDLLADNIMSATVGGATVYLSKQLIDGTNTSFVSDPVPMNNLDGICFQLVNEANGGNHITGTWKIEVSNNYVATLRPSSQNGANAARFPVQWTDITTQFSPSITQPSGTDLSQYVQAYPLVAQYIRVSFTRSAGSGLMTVTCFGKGNR